MPLGTLLESGGSGGRRKVKHPIQAPSFSFGRRPALRSHRALRSCTLHCAAVRYARGTALLHVHEHEVQVSSIVPCKTRAAQCNGPLARPHLQPLVAVTRHWFFCKVVSKSKQLLQLQPACNCCTAKQCRAWSRGTTRSDYCKPIAMLCMPRAYATSACAEVAQRMVLADASAICGPSQQAQHACSARH